MVAGPVLDEFDEDPTDEERRRYAPEITAAIEAEDALVDAVALAIAQATRRMARCAADNVWAKIDAMGADVDELDTVTWRYEARAALAAITERYRICNAHPAGDGVTWHLVDEWRPS